MHGDLVYTHAFYIPNFMGLIFKEENQNKQHPFATMVCV